ncbi:hypothetical protein BH11MYX4_BH11MYX4_21620 [soil metagenome]
MLQRRLMASAEASIERADHGTELRWRIDLPATNRRAYDLHIDLFERTTGRSSGWRTASTPRRWAEASRPLADLARSGRCEVLVEAGAPAQRLEIDEGAPFLAVIVVAENGPHDGESFPPLLVRGELRRGTETLRLEDLTAVSGTGFAFVGPRALPVQRGARFSMITRLRSGPIEVSSDHAEAFLRDLFSWDRPEAIDLPPSFVVERGGPRRTRAQVQRPARRPGARSLETAVVFEYRGACATWRSDSARVLFDARALRIVVRDREAERRAIDELVSAGFRAPGTRNASAHLMIAASRLGGAVAALPPERFVVEAEGIRHRRATSWSMRVRSGVDWLDLEASVTFYGVSVSAPAVLLAARRGEKLVRLDDGSVGLLPEEWLARVARLAALAGPESGDGLATGPEGAAVPVRLRFGRAQVALVDALLGAERDTVSWEGPLAALRGELARDLGRLPAAAPQGFHGELRDYPRAGVAWMQWLEGLGFAGCLADDMGLGKTIQVLALLADRRARGLAKGPSLVIAPRSVVHNWMDEARRFAPGLRVLELASSTPSARALQADLLVTTYGTIRRSADRRATMWFDYVVLDEAHAVKNATAVTSQAVRSLRCRHRLALTGTPVENHLGELVSLFDFLDPAMLGSSVREAVAEGFDLDRAWAAQIGRGLRPFLLRRTKDEVLRELPPRIDTTLLCTMEPAQRVVYERAKQHYRARLLDEAQRRGVTTGSSFEILEAILRLRQIACHPALVDEGRRHQRSAKLDVLAARLAPLVRRGRKALVFSQFTRLLDLVEQDLEARGIAFARLDGRTADRRAPVERFQTDPSCSVFLVSLKAGGVGLNLTAAEYVFLLDPWWNPAAEAQAIDLAHRMGQKRTVMAYRLICKDTIEERVAQLQEKKRALVSSVFGAAEGPAALSLADVEALFS